MSSRRIQILTIVNIAVCAFFAGANDGNSGIAGTAAHIFTLPIGAVATTTTTVTTTTTDVNGTVTRETTTTTRKIVDVIGPEDGDYSYLEYNGELVPYYKGYYYINGVWVWRGRGRPPFPPPKFRPRLLKPASAKPVSAKPAPVKSAPVKSAPRRVRAPKPPRR